MSCGYASSTRRRDNDQDTQADIRTSVFECRSRLRSASPCSSDTTITPRPDRRLEEPPEAHYRRVRRAISTIHSITAMAFALNTAIEAHAKELE